MSHIETAGMILPNAETRRETKTVFIHPPVSALTPNNPAGINSLLRVVRGEVGYRALNEEMLLGWMLTGNVLREVVETHQNDTQFQRNLQGFALSPARIEEVIEAADQTREAFKQEETYKDFDRFIRHKRILEDATKIISAPFMGDKEREQIIIHHNTVDYYNSRYGDSRAGLLRLSGQAALYKDYLERDALPKVLADNTSVIGISVTHPDQAVFAFQFAYLARQANPDAIILVGGNTIARRMESWVKNDETGQAIFRRRRGDKEGIIDGLMISEGEWSYADLTSRLVADPNLDLPELFKDLYSVIYNRDGRIGFHRIAPPVPPEDLWIRDVSGLLTSGFMPEGKKVFSIVDGRGCGHDLQTGGGCGFCSISKMYGERANEIAENLGLPMIEVTPQLVDGRSIPVQQPSKEIAKRSFRIVPQRRLGAERVAEEIAKGKEAGFTIVDITDEQFTVHQALELASAFERRGINKGKVPEISYAAYMRIDSTSDITDYRGLYGKPLAELLIDPQITERLYQSGLAFAQFGLETTAPWQMDAMDKGTTASKVKRFGTMLENFAEHNIMSHLFVIVGHPLKTDFWNDRSAILVEDKALGRPANANDLEIIGALYNLRFLNEHRNAIYTMKHTQYKLSAGSEHAMHPEKFGLVIRKENQQRRDITPNTPFGYMEGHGPSHQVIKDLLGLYDLWKKEVLPYQLVTQEYVYHQRLMLGAAKIREMAAALPQGELRLTQEDKIEKAEILQRMWRQLVGEVFLGHIERLDRLKAKGIRNRQTERLEKLLEEEQQTNICLREFPDGFTSYEDLYKVVELLDKARAGKPTVTLKPHEYNLDK